MNSAIKVLIVDDEHLITSSLEITLQCYGYKTTSANSGNEALYAVRSGHFHIALLDIRMPAMNGIEAAKEIRKIRKNLTIIAQTAFVFEDDKDIVLEAGCDACLIKPIRKDHLISVMSSFVKSERQ